MPPDHECVMEKRIDALEEDSRRNQVTHKQFFERFEEDKVKMAVVEERYNQIKADTTEIKGHLKETNIALQEITDKPAKRWDGLVDKSIWAIAGAFIAYFLAQVLK